ncbi:hypothetical protein [Ekhidna sp.]
MKNLLQLFLTLIILITAVGCNEDKEVISQVDIPAQFSVDIPTPISSNTGNLNGRTAGDGDGVIEGNEIYESVRYFIHLGESSAEILELTLKVGAALESQNVRSYTFLSDDDDREKRIEITENVTRGGETYAYEMIMVDTENSEQALQLLWNTSPVSGVAILQPYNIDRSDDEASENAFFRVDYTEDHAEYDAAMTISIAGVETVENGDIDNLKMFVGKKGDVVDVMGNSNHPNVVIIDEDYTGGRNYAFVGRGDESTDLGVIKLALPPSSTTTADVLTDFSVYAVLDTEIKKVADLDQNTIDDILAEALSPAYFNNDGFITSGPDNKPVSFSDSFVDLSGMNPFVPNDVKNLTIGFIQ